MRETRPTEVKRQRVVSQSSEEGKPTPPKTQVFLLLYRVTVSFLKKEKRKM